MHAEVVVFHVSVIDRTMTMDYRTFNVRTWSSVCVRIHTGVGDTDSESAQHFWLGKTVTMSCAADGSSDLVFDALSIEPLRHPIHVYTPECLFSAHTRCCCCWSSLTSSSQKWYHTHTYACIYIIYILYIYIDPPKAQIPWGRLGHKTKYWEPEKHF